MIICNSFGEHFINFKEKIKIIFTSLARSTLGKYCTFCLDYLSKAIGVGHSFFPNTNLSAGEYGN